MEETDMCHPIPTAALPQPPSQPCPAKILSGQQRQTLAVQVLAGAPSISRLADELDVSRKFIYQQVHKAQAALDEAFTPTADDDAVLFYLPVTKRWLRGFILALLLICHSSYRGVVEILRDLFGRSIAVGTIHNIACAAAAQARAHNQRVALDPVRHGAHDELYQCQQPVLVAVDVESTYCYLLSLEEQCDGDTWGLRLLELKDRGFNPQAIVCDGGKALQAGQALALPTVPRRGDVFHALKETTELITFLDNRAYQTIAGRSKLQGQQANHERRRGRRDLAVACKLRQARAAETQALDLAADVTTLARWLQHDILAVAGPSHAQRCALYDFVVAELQARAPLCPHRIDKVCTYLVNQRDALLAFAQQLDLDLATLAQEFQVPVDLVRTLLVVQAMASHNVRRWPQEAALRQQLLGRFHDLSAAVTALAKSTVRASSVVENLNSRLRNYFFLRRHLGPDYLELLQFFLNHRCFPRSDHPERVNKSPAELLTGQTHAHWLDLLGFGPLPPS
jgi:hypothetical protein